MFADEEARAGTASDEARPFTAKQGAVSRRHLLLHEYSPHATGPVYATVTTFRGWPDQTKTDWQGLLQKANPKADANALMQQTGVARKIVRTAIWQVLEQTDPPAMGTQ